MIYILSGVAKSGKTFIARKMLHDHHIASFSTDYLMMTLSRNKIGNINHEEDDKIVAKKMEPFLFEMIRPMAENNIEYLIEGVHFLPEFARTLLDRYPGKLKVVYLGFQDANVVEKVKEMRDYRFQTENCWYSNYSMVEMEKLVSFLIEESKRLALKAKQFEIPYVEIKDITIDANSVISYFLQVN